MKGELSPLRSSAALRSWAADETSPRRARSPILRIGAGLDPPGCGGDDPEAGIRLAAH